MKRILALLLIIASFLLVGCQEGERSTTDYSNEPFDADVKTYTVRYNNSVGGVIDGAKLQTVKEGEDASPVSAVPDEGYVFIGWSDGYKNNIRQDKEIRSNIFVNAIFTKEITSGEEPPIVKIYTANAAPITDRENYVDCTVEISGTDEEFCMSAESAGIRGRGNSTWDHHEKKSYRIKFESKRSVLGSEYKAKSWTLIANHADRTLSRNALAYEMAERFEDIAFASAHHFVELYLNDVYQGVYLLCDQTQTGEGRVDIDEDMTGDPDTGYLIELDCRASWEGTLDVDYFVLDYEKQYALKTPDPDDKDYDPQIYLSYIKKYMSDCLDALSAEDWIEICRLMDVDSFADVYIIQELFANFDCASYSFYFYKEKGGKLYCGPVWDFDLSVGNGYYGAGSKESYAPDSDIKKDGKMLAASTNTWFRRLLRNDEFVTIVKNKLEQYDNIIREVISLADPDNKNGYYVQCAQAFERNFKRWDILGKYVWPNPREVYEIDTVKDSFIYVRDWLTERQALMRKQFGLT